ncbi:MAG: manganese efflux pump MntP family protein [Oscillospiraceae bacterium]
MAFLELLLLAAGLAMDAFAVSLADGAGGCGRKKALLIAGAFGLFQGIMPCIGYFIGSGFAEKIRAVDHFVTLAALGLIGGKMIVESLSELRAGAAATPNGTVVITLPAILAQAVATSIDALVVGMTFAAAGTRLIPAVATIGSVTFALSLAGVLGGRRFGQLLGSRATLLGGIILVSIGIKTVIEHMFF